MIEEKGAIIRGFIRNAQTACITADSTPPPGVGTCLPCSHLWGLPCRANPDTTNLLIAPFLELHSVPCCWYRPSWSPLARSANANKTLVLKALITQTQTRALENVSRLSGIVTKPAATPSYRCSGHGVAFQPADLLATPPYQLLTAASPPRDSLPQRKSSQSISN